MRKPRYNGTCTSLPTNKLKSILRSLSQGEQPSWGRTGTKSRKQILSKLQEQGYLTSTNTLTESGREYLQS